MTKLILPFLKLKGLTPGFLVTGSELKDGGTFEAATPISETADFFEQNMVVAVKRGSWKKVKSYQWISID